MDHHNKDNPKNKGDNLMLTVTGLPKDLDEYIDYSMIAQAEGLKFGIEHFRRRKPHCSGALFWQLNDCWPVLSWSVIDYYGFPKAGYHYARRVFAPLLASFKEEPDGGVSLWITNDTLDAYRDLVSVRLATFDGQELWVESHKVDVPPNASQAVLHWGPEHGAPERYLAVYSDRGESDGAFFERNFHFFAPVKDRVRPPAQARVTCRAVSAHEITAEIEAQGFVYFFHLTHPSEHTRFSDNYFNLEDGEKRLIRIANDETEIKIEDVGASWR
jgi:beta-mannosidase